MALVHRKSMFAKWRTPHGPGTHVLMDGGILDVPIGETDAFYVAYIAAVRQNKRVYVVEQKTDIFRFFVDLDYKALELIDEGVLMDVLQKMCDVVPGRCLVARAPPRLIEDGLLKCGFHIHWPDTNVTRPEALAYRTRILMELDGPEWAEFIDASVYGGSGLRMLWSHKKPIGDPYVPWEPGQPAPEPDLETLRLFSIRTAESRPTTLDTGSHDALEQYIQKYIPGHERLRVKRVGQKGEYKWVQTDSRFCANIGAEHKSNHVWFSVYGDRICQMCHDADTCHGYVGREYLLSPSIVDVPVVDTVSVPICSLLPAHWFSTGDSIPVHSAGPPVLGSGSTNVGHVQTKHKSVRGRGGRGRGRTGPVCRNGEYS